MTGAPFLDKFARRIKLFCPSGKYFRFSELLSSLEIKNISLFRRANQAYIYRHPVPTRGALAIVTNAGRGAVDAEAATDERG